MYKRFLAAFIITLFIVNTVIIIRPVFSHNFSGSGIKMPEHLLIIYKQQIITMPIITIVLVELLVLVSLITIKQAYVYTRIHKSMNVKHVGKALMFLGMSIVPIMVIIGYSAVMTVLINGSLRPTVNPEIVPSSIKNTGDKITYIYGRGDAFYGASYVSVFHGLYEINPIEGKIWPTPSIFAIASIIFSTGLVMYIIMSKWKKAP